MTCYVIMPFGDERTNQGEADTWRTIFEQIKITVEAIEIEGKSDRIDCRRGDTDRWHGNVIDAIVEALVDADLVIADVTGRNPNVYYELGIRHALHGRTILLSQDASEMLPFDLRLQNVLFYTPHIKDFEMMRTRLRTAVREVLSNPYQHDNPVQSLLYTRWLRASRERAEFATPSPGRSMRRWRILLEEMLNDEQPGSSSPPPANGWLSGAWVSQLDGTLYFVQFVDGKWRGVYSRGSVQQMGGEIFDVRLLADQLVGRFRNDADAGVGYVWLDRRGDWRLDGGWWYSGDAPEEYFTRSVRGPGYVSPLAVTNRWGEPAALDPFPLNSLTLTRVTPTESWPDWAADYLRRFQGS